jgi:hypothetical protein
VNDERSAGTCHCRYCEPPPEQEIAFDASDRKLMADVKEHGWHVLIVGADARTDGWVYSIGMWHTLRSPELVMAGLPADSEHRLINDIGTRVRQGEQLDPAVPLQDLLTSGRSLAVRPVHKTWYAPLFGYAMWFAQRPPQPFLQVVWPDKQGRFPWDDGFDAVYRDDQPSLWIPANDHPMSKWSGVLAPHPWPFEDAENKTVFTTKRVTGLGALIQYVYHDMDGTWQFIDDGPTDREHIELVHLVHVVGANPAIASLADLPRGWMAYREAAERPWMRRPFASSE